VRPRSNLFQFLRFAIPTLFVALVKSRRKPPVGTDHGILIIRLDHIGDFVVFTPFLRELRRNYPNSKITLLSRMNPAYLAEACPYLNEVLVLDPRPEINQCLSNFRYFIAVLHYLGYLVQFAEQRLSGRFDLAISPIYSTDLDGATLIAYLSGAPMRIGYSEDILPDKRWANFGHDRLLTEALPPAPVKHEADRSLDVIRHLGGKVESRTPEMWLTPEDESMATDFLHRTNLLDGCPIIAFGIGAADARRQWPHYSSLIHMLTKVIKFHPLLIAGPTEDAIVQAITIKCPDARVMEGHPLRTVEAVLTKCLAFMGNDSGPMHLAAAANLPVVEISCHPIGGKRGHGNDPERHGPLCDQKLIIRPKPIHDDCLDACEKDFPHCISNISPEEVASAAMNFLSDFLRSGLNGPHIKGRNKL
jgi:ADP-heptose:LPS heptosyltransferase